MARRSGHAARRPGSAGRREGVAQAEWMNAHNSNATTARLADILVDISMASPQMSRRMVDMNDELPCLDLLEATPAILRGVMSEISADDARWKPAPDRFSIAEVLAHLAHSESDCYRARVERFLAEELPEFEPDDAQMHLDLYRNADPEEEFGHFEERRESNVELLRGLAAETGSRRARHRAAGEITLSHMLHEWALHDLGHIRQVAELARARKYLAGAGPLGAEYQLRP